MPRTIKLTGRTADELPPEPLPRPECVVCKVRRTGACYVRMDDGWHCAMCLTENQRRVWLRIYKDAKE